MFMVLLISVTAMNVRMIPAIGMITFSESVRIMANTPGEKFAGAWPKDIS